MNLQAILLPALGFCVVFGGVVLTLIMVSASRGSQRTGLQGLLTPSQDRNVGLDLRPDILPALTRLLSQARVDRSIQISIVRAGLLLRPSELIVMSLAAAAVGAFVGYLVVGILGFLIGAAVLGALPWAMVAARRSARSRALMLQLPDALDLVCSSLRAGHGVSQALKTAAEQTPPPFCQEAARVVAELGLGFSLNQALGRMVERTGQADVELMCTAVQIQTRTGGNLAEVLANIAAVIRERIELHGEVRALTAEGRLSGVILTLLPPVMAVVLSIRKPGWLDPLVTDPIGRGILTLGVILLLTGILVTNKMLKVDI
jgi:tight adherence protein B